MDRGEAESALEEAAGRLVAAVEAALPGWVHRRVTEVLQAQGALVEPEVKERAARAGDRAVAEVVPALSELVTTDPDEQTSTPLEVIRQAVVHPTRVLEECGAQPARRDRFHAERFPHDPFDLIPAAFADLGEEVHEAGLRWGVARAAVHRARHDA